MGEKQPGSPALGNAVRFTALWGDYVGRVSAYACRHADGRTTQDVASQAFLVAWRRWLSAVPDYRNEAHPMTKDLLKTLEAMRPDTGADDRWPQHLQDTERARIMATDSEPTAPAVRSRRVGAVAITAALFAVVGIGAVGRRRACHRQNDQVSVRSNASMSRESRRKQHHRG
ncbi:hypothetical protein AB4Z09_27000 [Rhodococcus sp. TAF43]|uniref:hypothetical protein n=1 Tax=Rhodococcus sp. TAF43 TaxID=3237483 RepID=UPI003F97BB52